MSRRRILSSLVLMALSIITGVGLGWRIWADKFPNGVTMGGSTGFKLGGQAFEVIEFEDDRDGNGVVERRWLAMEYGDLQFSIHLENDEGVSPEGPLKITLDSNSMSKPFGILQVIASELDEQGYPNGEQTVFLPARSGDRPVVYFDFNGDGYFDLLRDPNTGDGFVVMNGASHEIVRDGDEGKFGPYSIVVPAGTQTVIYENGAWRKTAAAE